MNDIKIDKTGWKKYRFDEVCCQVNVSTKNPEAEGLKYVVGLEHIEPNNLHITRWDTLEKETTFTRKFIKGQVLFGRRRAYQRKVAYTEFDGICSGDILVFEAINDVLIPELLPFLIQSEGFFQKALETSAGSLSPRTKFKDLADYEFLLPPKAEQQRLAELLWAADDVVEKEKVELERVKEVYKLQSSTKFGVCNNGTYLAKNDRFIKIDKLLLQDRCDVGKLDTKDYKQQGMYPIIDQSKNEIAAYSDNSDLIYKGNLPVLIFGDHTTIIKYVDYPFILGADGTKILTVNEKMILAKYLFFAIENLNLTPQGYRRHFSVLKELEIPVISIKEQRVFIDKMNDIEINLQHCNKLIALSQQMKQELINKIF